MALLYVDGEVAVNGVTVEPIVMAERDAEDFVGAECQIAGWGQTEGERYFLASARCSDQL